jgi:two-component sensor histidine kinase
MIRSIYSLCLVLLLLNRGANAQNGHEQAISYYQQSLDKGLAFQQTVRSGLKALDYSRAIQDDSLTTCVLIQLGILYWHDGQFDKAWRYLNEGQLLSTIRKDQFNQAKSFHYKGLVQYYRCKFDSALHWYNKAEGAYQKLKMDSARAKIKSHKGLIYSATGQYRLAIQNTIESFKLQESLPGYRDMSIPMQFSSPSEESLYYKSKLEKDLESLRFVKLSGNEEKLAFTDYNIGLDYYHLKKYEGSLPYFHAASTHYQNLHEPSFRGSIADAFKQIGNYDSAFYYYHQWIKEVKERGTQIHLAAAYSNLADCYRIQKEWRSAYDWFDSAYALNKRMGLKRSEAQMGKAMAKMLTQMNEWRKALPIISNSLQIATEIGCIRDMQELLEIKSEILLSLQEYKKAAVALQQSKLLRDSVMNGDSQLDVARLQIEYESEKKSSDLQKLKSENELSDVKIDSQKLQIALVFTILCLITIVGSSYFYRYRKNKKLNRWLQVNNKEKEVLLHEIHHRVKNNLQIISSLINILSPKINEPQVKGFLVDLSNKVHVMGLVHDMLYKQENIERVKMDTYLPQLTNSVASSLIEVSLKRVLVFLPTQVELTLSHALTLGLIHNELLTNAIKYARPEEVLSITYGIYRDPLASKLVYFIQDNGTTEELIQPSFGMKFVEQMTKQKLGGEMRITTDEGMKVQILFNDKN